MTQPSPVESGDLPDPNDRCPTIANGCPGSEDTDGCPDVELALGPQCVFDPRTQATLRDIAAEMKKEKRLTTLTVVVSDKDCAALVTKRLVEAGVSAGRIESRITSPHGLDIDATFEVAAWEGKRCGH